MEIRSTKGNQDLERITGQFNIHGNIYEIVPYGSGHIHDTYLVKILESYTPGYILQRINHEVFKNIDDLMHNISIVTAYFDKQRSIKKDVDHIGDTPQLIKTHNDGTYHEKNGEYWRIFTYIPESNTYQKVLNEQQAFEAGKIIGRFQNLLSGMNETLRVTIPDFHNLDFRLNQFDQALKENKTGRVNMIGEEVEFIQNQRIKLRSFSELIKNKKFPLRITHNDTKINNILFDTNDQAICLIDLDTVMPGYVFYDFGDAIRTMANNAEEDEKDLKKVSFSTMHYSAFTKGYYQEADVFLTTIEKDWLPYSPVYMTFIMGLRFLTDYINGDIYYQTDFPDHNFVRARCQFELIKRMEGWL